MLELGVINIAVFCALVGTSLAFVIAWIIKSEAKINVCKKEIIKLKTELASSEREKFAIAEKLVAAEGAGTGSEDLAGENIRLKNELAEAKSSLEEVYKALLSQS